MAARSLVRELLSLKIRGLNKEQGFVEKVRIWWDSFQFFGSPSFVLAKKLKAFKWEIKIWNLEEFGDVRERNKARELEEEKARRR